MQEFENFLKTYPNIDTVELIIIDPNGRIRGKWAPVSALKKAFSEGVNFPLSIHALDVWGGEVSETGLHIETGDVDGFFKAASGTLTPITWGRSFSGTQKLAKSAAECTHAQVIIQAETETGQPLNICPRTRLQTVLDLFKQDKLAPTVAFEMEFYLIKPQSEWRGSQPEAVGANDEIDRQRMYSLNALSEHAELFEDIYFAAKLQGLPVDTLVKEAAPGQYEINLNHRSDAMRACDDVIMLKRTISECARAHGLIASFMAKPFLDQPGNGMHVHASLVNDEGKNIFAGNEGRKRLESAIACLVETMMNSTLIFVNSYNGFRRLTPGSYAPTSPIWGENNRSVSVRIPAAPDYAQRLEHRISGADANPYLVMATLIYGMYEGIKNKLTPPAPVEGNAYEGNYPTLPDDMGKAIDLFEGDEFITRALGQELKEVLVHIKRNELKTMTSQISSLEIMSYL